MLQNNAYGMWQNIKAMSCMGGILLLPERLWKEAVRPLQPVR